jgi:hypothetical protein
MKKLSFYLIVSTVTIFTLLLPSCGKIDDSNSLSPAKLQRVEEVLKDNNFIQLMNVRKMLDYEFANSSTKGKSIPLSQIKTNQDFESKVIDMGFASLKEYNELMSAEIYYLEKLRETVSSVSVLNEANKLYLDIEKEKELEKFKKAKTCTQCSLEYVQAVDNLKDVRDLTKNNCAFTRDQALNACPQQYFPERRICITPRPGAPFTFLLPICLTLPAGYYYTNNCPDSINATYDNCINNANAIYDSAYDSATLTFAICTTTCTN